MKYALVVLDKVRLLDRKIVTTHFESNVTLSLDYCKLMEDPTKY